ncbi:MAG: phosphoadenylyl-sulfate reductase [Thalassolituus sp.]|jgi:phosphoadenosine phosphosulfate reductase|uniref:phosphoadenylyl-sulfate reductase n=1 Tax=Thalassolituus sp. TaxID=2030822 RepID=UPI003981E0B9
MNNDLKALNEAFTDKRPKDLIRHALEQHSAIGVSFSGAEDVILVDMAVKLNANVDIFTLDTGRLHPETYEFIEKVRSHYGIKIDIRTPEQQALQTFVREKGLFSFYEDGHQECCGVRKIAPLKAKLATLDAWITGQRRDQSPGTRNDVNLIEIDSAFQGANGELTKYNPLALWTSAQVWEYIKIFDVPFNSLHQQGFVSIGCQPCTRATLPNQHEREGRWWWEGATHKECGLHAGNIISKG